MVFFWRPLTLVACLVALSAQPSLARTHSAASRHSAYRHNGHNQFVRTDDDTGQQNSWQEGSWQQKEFWQQQDSGNNKLPGSGKTSQAIQPLAVMLKLLQRGTAVEAVNMSKGGIAARPNRVLAMVRNCKAWRNNRRARTAFRLRWSIASSHAKAAAIRARSVAAITA